MGKCTIVATITRYKILAAIVHAKLYPRLPNNDWAIIRANGESWVNDKVSFWVSDGSARVGVHSLVICMRKAINQGVYGRHNHAA